MVSAITPAAEAAASLLSPDSLRRGAVRPVPGVRRDDSGQRIDPNPPQKPKSVKDRILSYLGLEDAKTQKIKPADTGAEEKDKSASGIRISKLENSAFQAQTIAQSNAISGEDGLNAEQRRGLRVFEDASLARIEFLPAYQPVDLRV